MSNYDDVYDFHQKYSLLNGVKPRQLTRRKLAERAEFLMEELDEFMKASGLQLLLTETHPLHHRVEVSIRDDWKQDIGEQADALIDLVYVAMGTAVMMGLPWQALWDDVQRANMSKVRGTTKRGHPVDVTKPEGWVGPKTQEILDEYGYDPAAAEVDDEI